MIVPVLVRAECNGVVDVSVADDIGCEGVTDADVKAALAFAPTQWDVVDLIDWDIYRKDDAT